MLLSRSERRLEPSALRRVMNIGICPVDQNVPCWQRRASSFGQPCRLKGCLIILLRESYSAEIDIVLSHLKSSDREGNKDSENSLFTSAVAGPLNWMAPHAPSPYWALDVKFVSGDDTLFASGVPVMAVVPTSSCDAR